MVQPITQQATSRVADIKHALRLVAIGEATPEGKARQSHSLRIELFKARVQGNRTYHK